MRPVTTRLLRPRLLLLPLVFAVLVAPVYLRTGAVPAAEHDLHRGAVCSNRAAPREPLEPAPEVLRHSQPSCVQCRAPLLNAPLAQVPREAPAHTATSPAA
jgi:hypothetical protein